MTCTTKLHFIHDQLEQGETAVGVSMLVVSVIWGTLIGGLALNDASQRIALFAIFLLAGILGFAARCIVLARSTHQEVRRSGSRHSLRSECVGGAVPRSRLRSERLAGLPDEATDRDAKVRRVSAS